MVEGNVSAKIYDPVPLIRSRFLDLDWEFHGRNLGDVVPLYRHEWRTGDLVVVDNVAVAHLAAPETQTPRDVAGLRVLDRVVVAGVAGRDALAPLGEAPRLVG